LKGNHDLLSFRDFGGRIPASSEAEEYRSSFRLNRPLDGGQLSSIGAGMKLSSIKPAQIKVPGTAPAKHKAKLTLKTHTIEEAKAWTDFDAVLRCLYPPGHLTREARAPG